MTFSRFTVFLALATLTIMVSATAGTVYSNYESSPVSVNPTHGSYSAVITINSFPWTRQYPNGNKFGQYWDFFVGSMSLCTLKCAPYSYPAYSNGQLYCARDLTYYSRLNIATGSAYKSKCLPDMSMGGYCSGAATSVFTYYMDTCTTASLPSSGDYDCCFNNANTEESISYITDKDATVV